MKTTWLLLKNLLFTLLVPGFVAGWLPLFWLRRGPILPESWVPWHFAALPLLLAGAAVYAHCVWHFASYGRGTPAPIDAPKRLVQRGLYRWVRNPMYLGVLLFILGETIFFRQLVLVIHLVCVASLIQVFVLAYEEPTLQRRFGALYSDYCNAVHRWLPRRPRPRLETVPPFGTGRGGSEG